MFGKSIILLETAKGGDGSSRCGFGYDVLSEYVLYRCIFLPALFCRFVCIDVKAEDDSTVVG